MVMNEFEDIKIIEVDKDLTYQPDKNLPLYYVYLKLSALPAIDWVEIFNSVRKRTIRSKISQSQIWIEGKYIVVYCTLNQTQEYLKYLKEDIKTANKEYRKRLDRLEQYRKIDIQRNETEKKKMNDALDKLDL